MTPEELSQASGVVIVDIRKSPDGRMIPGSIRLDGAALESGEAMPFADDAKVVLYCGSGNSCTRISAVLRERGIDARALEGGYVAWRNADLPTEAIS